MTDETNKQDKQDKLSYDELFKSLQLAYQQIANLEEQLAIAQQGACIILGLDFEKLKKEANGL